MSIHARALLFVMASALVIPPFAVSPVHAAESVSASYRNTRSAVNAGGRRKTSTSYRMDAAAGEQALSTATSASYLGRDGLIAGYHYPSALTDLWGSTTAVATSVYLQWTSPGNDGSETTTPGRYLVRYSSLAAESPALSNAKFDAATPVTPAPPAAQVKGSRLTLTVTGLQQGVTYYFAAKTAERDGTRSVLSGGATVQTNAPDGCVIVRNVHKTDGPYTTIQAAVNALPLSLNGYACVIIRDAATYGEQVTVEGFTNNGSSISIFTDPALSARAVVDPPASSTAAFVIKNASVNVYGVDVKPTVEQATYGVYSSSSYVKISSMNIDAGAGVWTAALRVSSWTTVEYSSVSAVGVTALWLDSSSGTVNRSSVTTTGGSSTFALRHIGWGWTISSSTVRNSGASGGGVQDQGRFLTLTHSTITATSNGILVELSGYDITVADSYMQTGGSGVSINGSPDRALITRSTVIASSTGLRPPAHSTVTYMFIRSAAFAAVSLFPSDTAIIRFSTIVSLDASANGMGLNIWLGQRSIVEHNYIQGSSAVVVNNTNDVRLGSNRLVGTRLGSAGVHVTGAASDIWAASNTVLAPSQGRGVYIDGANGLVSVSSNVVSGGYFGVSLATQASGARIWVTSNTVAVPIVSGVDTFGIRLDGLLTGATIADNTFAYRASGGMGAGTSYAFYARTSSGVVVERNRFSNPGMITGGSFTGIRLSDVDKTSFLYNDLHSTGTTLTDARLVQLGEDSTDVRLRNNIFFSSFAVSGASATLAVAADSQSGFSANYNDYVSSNPALSFVWGAAASQGLTAWRSASSQDANSISLDPQWFDPRAGVEDFHPRSSQGRWTAGGFVADGTDSPTLDAADPADAYGNETAPNGSRANQGSYGNTNQASRSLGGYPGCAVTHNVGSGQTYASIGAGVAALPTTLTGHSCVVIKDGATYAEQVTIQNFVNNGSSISIFADPASGLRPLVRPGGGSAAGFIVRNTSVNIAGLDIASNGSLTYGVFIASYGAKVSSVNIKDATGGITAAGVYLSSRAEVTYTSVTVVGASGFYLEGVAGSTVSFSTAVANGGGAALYLTGATSNTVADGFFHNQGGDGAVIAAASHGNSIVRSTMTTAAVASGLYMASASSNAFSGVYIGAANGVGLHLAAGSVSNTVAQSTVANNSAGNAALYVAGASSNTFADGRIANASGDAAVLAAGSRFMTLLRSTAATGGASVALYVSASSSHSVIGSYLNAPAGVALRLSEGAHSNAVVNSTAVAGASFAALYLENASTNSFVGSRFIGGLGDAVQFFTGSDYNSIVRSTVIAAASGISGAYWQNSSSNSVTHSYFHAPTGVALNINSGSEGNVVSGSTLTNGNAAYSALYMSVAGSNTFTQGMIVSTGGVGVNLLASPFMTVRLSTIVAFSNAVDGNGSHGLSIVASDLRSSNQTAVYVGASSLTVTGSTITATAGSATALYVLNGSSLTVRASLLVSGFDGIGLDGFYKASIESSSVTAAAGGSGLYAVNATSVTVLATSLRSSDGYAANIAATTVGLSVRRSTLTVDGGGSQTLYVSGARGVELADSTVGNSVGADAVYFNDVRGALITRSTINATGAATAAFAIDFSSDVTVTRDYIRGARGVWSVGSTNTVVSLSQIHSIGASNSAVLFTEGNVGVTVSSNVLRGGSDARGVYVDAFGGLVNMGAIHIVTNTISGSASGVEIGTTAASARVFIASNSIHTVPSTTYDPVGIMLYGLAGGATVQNNSIYSRTPGSVNPLHAYGFYVLKSTGVLFERNRINQPGMVTGGSYTGIRLHDAHQVTLMYNDVHSTAAAIANAFLVRVLAGSNGVRLYNNIVSSSFTVTGTSATIVVDAASVADFRSDYNTAHSSNDFKSGLWAGTSLSMLDGSWGFVTGNDANSVGYTGPGWRSVAAGAEDFHLLSRQGRYNPLTQAHDQFDTMDSEGLDGGRPSDAYALEPAPNGGRVNQGSYGNTPEASMSLSYGCVTQRKVSAAGPYTNFTDAVSSVWPDLVGHTCVIVQDASTYPEQVSVEGFTNNGSSISIMADPYLGLRAAIDPPSASTAAFFIKNASVNVLNIDVKPTVQQVAYGVYASSAYVRLSSVNVDSAGMIWGAGVRVSSRSIIEYSSVTVALAHGYWLDGSTFTTMRFSTAIANSGANYGLFLQNATSNTISNTYVSTGTLVFGGSDNLISSSVLRAASSSHYGLWANGSPRLTVIDSFIENPATNGQASQILSGINTAITRSTFTAFNNALTVSAAGLRITDSYVEGGCHGVLSNAGTLSITSSTLHSTSASCYALYINGPSDNRVSYSRVRSPVGTAVLIDSAVRPTIVYSTVTADGVNRRGVHMLSASSATISASYVQASTAVYIQNSTGAVIDSSVLVATNTAGDALRASGGLVNLTVTSSTLLAASQGRGLAVDGVAANGVLLVGSVTVSGAGRAVELSTAALNFSLAVSSINFRALASGATAVHFLGGTFVSTITSASFEDAGTGANVSGAALSLGSRVTMKSHYGARTGPPYENDPNNLVDWEGYEAYPGCAVTNNVGAGKPYPSIGAGVAALPSTLPGHSCVVIRDAATYGEQVDVLNFTNNGSSISIFTDPAVAARAVVDPPGSSTAAFRISNASVNVFGIDIRVDQAVPYGIWASSSHVRVSSVAVSTSGGLGLYTAGIRLASWSDLSYSSVTAWNAHGVMLDASSRTSVSYTTATTFNGGFAGLYLNASDSNTITTSYFQNMSGRGVQFSASSDYNSVSQSTAIGSSMAGLAGFELSASMGNSVTGCWIDNGAAFGMHLMSGSHYNTIAQSTITGNNATYHRLRIASSSSNTVTGCYLANPSGPTVRIDNTANYNMVALSTIVAAGGGANGYALAFEAADGNMLSSSTLFNSNGYALQIQSSSRYNRVVGSTITSTGGGAAIYITNSSSNTIAGSYVQSATAAHVNGSTSTVFIGSVLVATNTSGHALTANNVLHLTVSTSSLRAGSSGVGLHLHEGSRGVVSLGSVTVTGAGAGVRVSTGGLNFSLAFDSVTFRGLASGATAIHFLGGTFVATITAAGFEDAGVGANVVGAPLNVASRVTMKGFSGPRGGPSYENDPNNLVDWEGYEAYPGCVVTRNVGAGKPFATISLGVAALPSVLTGHSCVVIRDAGSYVEQVDVSNFTNNGSSISIFTDPAVSARAVVAPPAASTAAFRISNASVNVFGLEVRVDQAVPYGIWASSSYIRLSSVTVSTNGSVGIYEAGVRVSSWSSISYSSVTVGVARAVWVSSAYMTSVADSSMTNVSVYNSLPALVVDASSATTVSRATVYSYLASAASIEGGSYGTQILGSSLRTDWGRYALRAAASSSTTLRASSVFGYDVWASVLFDTDAHLTTIDSSVIVSSNSSSAYEGDGSSGTIVDSYFHGLGNFSDALGLYGGGPHLILRSTFTALLGGSWVYPNDGGSVTITSSHFYSRDDAFGSYVFSPLRIDNSVFISLLKQAADFESELLETSDNMVRSGGSWALTLYGGPGSYVERSTITTVSTTGGALDFWSNTDGLQIRDSYVACLGGANQKCGSFNSTNTSVLRSTMVSNNLQELFTLNDVNGVYGSVYDSFLHNLSANGRGVYLGWRSRIERSTVTTMGGAAILSSDWESVLASVYAYSASGAALYLNASSTLTAVDSAFYGSTAVYVSNSSNVVIGGSLLVAHNASGAALDVTRGGDVTVSSSALRGGEAGYGARFRGESVGVVRLSTNIITGARYGVHAATGAAAQLWIASNTVVLSTTSVFDTAGLYLDGLASGATIQGNNVVLRAAGGAGGFTAYGLYARSSSRLKIDHNRISDPGLVTGGSYVAVRFSDVDYGDFSYNDVHSTGTGLTDAYLFSASEGSIGGVLMNNVFFSSWTVSGSSAIASFTSDWSGVSDYNDWFSSNALTFQNGTSHYQSLLAWRAGAGQDFNSISANPQWFSPGAGVEDFHPRSTAGRWNPGTGAFVNDGSNSPTIDAARPTDDFSLEVSPNGARANQGSYGGTAEASRTGNTSYPGCTVTRNVGPGQPYASISLGVAALPATLTGHSCVVVRDAGIYAEQVAVQNFVNNGSSISIFTDPAVGARAIVAPPASSTAAFLIANASVNVHSIDVVPPSAVQYGVKASSDHVRISSVTVDAPATIWGAGIAVSSYATVTYSSVTVGLSHSYVVDGSSSLLANDYAMSNGAGFAALYLPGASYSTFTVLVASNPAGHGLVMDFGARYNYVSYSTITVLSSAGNALRVVGSSYNVVAQSFIHNPAGYASSLRGGSSSNTITGSVSRGATGTRGGLFIATATYNTVVNSFIENPQGHGAVIFSDADYNTIDRSTVTGATNGGTGVFFTGRQSSNTITRSYVFCQGCHGVYLDVNSSYNTISLSSIASRGMGDRYPVRLLGGASYNTLSRLMITNDIAGGVVATGQANFNRVEFSTIVTGGTGGNAYGVLLNGVSSWTISGSYIQGTTGAYVTRSTGAVFNYNTIASSANAVYLTVGSVNLTLASNTLVALPGATGGVLLDPGTSGDVSLTSNTILGHVYGVSIGTRTAGATVWITSNTVELVPTSASDAYGMLFDGLQTGATIENNTIVTRRSGSMGAFTLRALHLKSSRGLVISRNRLSNPGNVTGGSVEMVLLDDADDIEYGTGDTYATGTALTNAYLVRAVNGSTGLRMSANILFSSFSVSGASATIALDAASGIGYSDYNDYFSSNSLLSFEFAGAAAQGLAGWRAASGSDLQSISAHPQWFSPQTEDFHPRSTGGRYDPSVPGFVIDGSDSPTIDQAPASEDYSLETMPNGARMNQGSYGGTAEASRTGNSNFPGCVETRNVGAGQTYATIQDGVNALSTTLLGHSCVVIRDAATYAEQVNVVNFVNNGSSISIFTDPAVGSRAVLDPPAASTAAFQVMNASVNIHAIDVRPTVEALSYGVLASSAYIRISSMNVDAGGLIWQAGMRLSSWTVVSHASVTAIGAHGFWLAGSTATGVYFSSAAAGRTTPNRHGVFFEGASSATFSVFYATSAAWSVVHADAASHRIVFDQAVLESTKTGGGFRWAVRVFGSSFTFRDSTLRFYGPQPGMNIGGEHAVVLRSTVIATAPADSTLSLLGNYATVDRFYSQAYNYGAESYGDFSSIQRSTFIATVNIAVDIGGSSTTVDRVYIRSDSYTSFFNDMRYGTFSNSTVTASNYGAYSCSGGTGNNLIDSVYIQGATNNPTRPTMELCPGDRVTNSTVVDMGLGYGVELANGATIYMSRVSAATTGVRVPNTVTMAAVLSSTLTATSGYGLLIERSSATLVLDSYVQGSTGVYVVGSTSTVIGGSALVATDAAASAIIFAEGSAGLRIATSTLLAPSLGRGMVLSSGNTGVVSVGSVTFSGPSRAIEVSTQAAGFSLAVDSVTFRNLASGATAIHFLGGVHVATVTLANFEDASVMTNVSGAALDLASRVTMRSFYGPRFGPDYENDPNSLVDWIGLDPPTNVALWFVGMSSAGLTYNTVGADGYTVAASTRADFPPALTVSSTVFGTQDRLTVTPLMPNTTYFLRAGALYGATTIYAQTVVTTATLSKLVTGTTVYNIHLTSMVVNWVPLALAPPDASSNSAQGYVLQASSMSTFLPLWQTSATPNVALSTLTIDSLRGGVTYYFRVGSLNHNNVPHFAGTVSTLMPVQLGVELTTHTISVPGLVNLNSTVLITTSVIVTNTGNVKETYWVRATTVSVGSPWTIGATQGVDRYVMSMLINGAEPATGDFGAEDRLADPEAACNATVFAFGGDCVQVPVGGTRTLWFKLDTPIVTSTNMSQDIRIYVRAVRDPDPDPNP